MTAAWLTPLVYCCCITGHIAGGPTYSAALIMALLLGGRCSIAATGPARRPRARLVVGLW
jgi:hypothetical protein